MRIQEFFHQDKTVKESTVRQIVFGSCLVLYFTINLIFLLLHEPYRDEANVWQMAKNLSPLALIREIHYQGHPCLWYLLVMPFAKLGLPYRTIEVLSLLIMCSAAFLFVEKARLIGIAKITCLFSPIFLYFYPVIARGYCLIILLLCLVAMLHPNRFQKPLWYGLLLGLLVQADTISVGLAGGLSLAWLAESLFRSYASKKDKKAFGIAVKGLWIPFCSFLFWIVQMAAEFGQMGGSHGSFSRDSFGTDCKQYAYYMVERLTGWKQSFIFVFFVVLLVASIALCAYSRKATGLFVFLFEYTFMSVFSIVVYGLHIWHFITLAFSFFWMVWMLQADVDRKMKKEKSDISGAKEWILKSAKYVLNILVVIFAVACFLHWDSEDEPSSLQEALHGVYSNAGETAAFIEENIPKDAVLVSTNVAFDTSVLAFLDDYEMHYATSGQVVNHAIYVEEELKSATVEDIENWMNVQYPDVEKYYLIVSGCANLSGSDALKKGRLLYQSEVPSNRGEDYRIFEMTR